jgi:lysozyme family protein
MELSQNLEKEYLSLWESCEADPSFEHALSNAIRTIKEGRTAYQSVSDVTGVPWYVVAVIHGLESNYNFNSHLHNGDPLDARTSNVPEGRPLKGNPPFTWEESAIDALEYDRALGIRSWNLPTLFWFLEGFNGWGYRVGAGINTTPPSRSAYIYSGSKHYKRGKYGSDGVFDPGLVSQQLGCMILLKRLQDEGLIDLLHHNTNQYSRDAVGSVAAWQHLLNGAGYFPTLFVNGHMDSATVNTTKKFQSDLGLSATGSVDLVTWQAGMNHKKLSGWQEIVPSISGIVSAAATVDNGINYRLHSYYSKESNYEAVYDNVLSWYGSTSNGCVAFVSSALRLSGFNVPIELNDEGYNISLWTGALSDYLEQKGWSKSFSPETLMPGDVVFTDDGGHGDGVPMHVYVFSRWHDASKRVAWVIDNQKFTHRRNIFAGGGGFNFTPFSYYLRA